MRSERPNPVSSFRVVFFVFACFGSLAEAGSPPSSRRCPCSEARAKLPRYRFELKQMQERLKDKKNKNPMADEAAIEEQITDLGKLSQCACCPKRVRSEADLVLAGVEGVLAKDYDSWGTKKGEDGRRSFRAIKEATRVDSENLAAWTSYGKALSAISHKTLKNRIAKYLSIDLATELKCTAAAIRRLLAKTPSRDGGAREALAELDHAIK